MLLSSLWLNHIQLFKSRPRLHDLGVIDETQSDFREIARYGKATQPQVPIVRFDAPLIFTNVDIFKKKLRQVVDKLAEGSKQFGNNDGHKYEIT